MVEARDGLVVVGEVSADIGDVGQKIGNYDFFGSIGHFGDTGPLSIVGKAAAGAVRVGEADVEVEGAVGVVGEEGTGCIGEVGGAARVEIGLVFEGVHCMGFDVFFADAGGGKTGLTQALRRRTHMAMGREAVQAVAVPVLAVGVAVLAGEDTGAADGAGG